MKKRRELDALVGNVKTRRKKSRNDSGHELLRSNDSESSEGDDFHMTHGKKRETGLCSTCTTITFLLVLVCMLVCAGLIWMHLELKTDLENLRMNLKSVESKGMVNSEDVMKLQGVVIHINKTLELETKTSKQLLNNITSINTTIIQLAEKLDKISEGIKSAPEIKQIPEKLKMFSTTLAEMGSDVSSLKETVKSVDPFHRATTTKLDNLTKQIEQVKQKVDAESRTSDELSPELANLLQLIPQSVQELNSTVSGQISVMMKSLSTYEEKFLQMENLTKTLAKTLKEMAGDHSDITEAHNTMSGGDWTSDQFKSSVTDIVQGMLLQMRSNVSQSLPLPESSHINASVANLTQLLQRIDNLEKLQSSGPGEAGSSQESLETLRDTLEAQVQEINRTLLALQSDQVHVTSLVVGHSNTLTTLTHQINATQYYVNRLEQSLKRIQAAGLMSTVTTTATSVPFTTSGKIEGSSQSPTTVGSDIENSNKEPTKAVKDEAPAPHINITDQIQQQIVIPHIETANQLKAGFHSWSRGRPQVQILYEDLKGFLGPHDTPKEEQLVKFDTDNSGSYSLEEISNALGIPLDEEESIPKDQSTNRVPPR